ncbi:hypothetical protein [Actinoplanes sp. TFC3]|uniref:hypothetical protein n=1 Tax=Actinoplanes sp. TFC3 TaxID=1710355 RepID=UPI000A4FDFF6|nr:hypothetical protein [Actinoplanes sp. TFC3]
MATVAPYVDGFNLYYGMKSKYGRKRLWLDVVELIRTLRPNDDVAVVHYFTAVVKNEQAAADNQDHYIEALKSVNGSKVDVHLGRFKTRTIGACRRCGQPYICLVGASIGALKRRGRTSRSAQ